jgi:hypothetical protein
LKLERLKTTGHNINIKIDEREGEALNSKY